MQIHHITLVSFLDRLLLKVEALASQVFPRLADLLLQLLGRILAVVESGHPDHRS